jgi:hypothetical protein
MRFNSFFKICIIAAAVATLPCCKNPATENASKTDSASVKTAPVTDTLPSADSDTDTSQYSTLYFTITDTGQDYYVLRAKMYALHKSLHWPIDTMDRSFDPAKNKIVVSDTDEDEMYRGEYYPRRSTSENLSLEYYGTYVDKSTRTNICLIAGIYETKKSADSLLALLKPHAAHAFVVAGQMYNGCMH